MKKISKIGISMVSCLAILGGTVFATTGKVNNTSKGLVLRGAASKSGAALATVAEGTEVEILEKAGEWYKVNANGQEGYLFAEYVAVTEETTPAPVDNASTNTVSGDKKIHILPLVTSSTIGTVPAGTELNVEKTVGKWNYITYQNVRGWVRANAEANETTAPAEEQQPEAQSEETTAEQPAEETHEEQPNIVAENTNLSFTKGYINVDSANVRKEPSTSSQIVTTLILNTGVTITAQTDEWYKITYGDYVGYIYKPLISENPTVTNRSLEIREANTQVAEETQNTTNQVATVENTTPAPAENTTVTATPVTSTSAGQKIVDFAMQYKGRPYVYGGTTPSGFDCSGFIYYVLNSCGYSISRSCTVQAQSGTAVSKSELQPGDIVFFNNTSSGAIGHVGIYIGGRKHDTCSKSKKRSCNRYHKQRIL